MRKRLDSERQLPQKRWFVMRNLYRVPASVIAYEVALLAQIACGYVPGRTAKITRLDNDVIVESLDCGDHDPIMVSVSISDWQSALRVCVAGANERSEVVEGRGTMQELSGILAMTRDQADMFELFEFGTAGIVPGKTPGTWIVYDSYGSVDFDFDPRDLLGPMTAYTVWDADREAALAAIRAGEATIRTKERLPPLYVVEWSGGGPVQSYDFGTTNPRSLL